MLISRKTGRRVARGKAPESAKWAFERLFDASEVGVLFDPSDTSTLFQNIVGTPAVATPGEPVGLILDKSLGSVLGPELISNGDFSGGFTGWSVGPTLTATIVGGEAEIVGAGTMAFTGSNHFRTTYNVVLIGKYYSISFDATWVSGGNLEAGVGYNPRIQIQPNLNKTRYTFVTRAGESGGDENLKTRVCFAAPSGTVWRLDNISAKEIPGNHATQATAGARPTYGVMPNLRRRNLLRETENFDSSTWPIKTAVTIDPVSVIAPNGTLTARQIVETTALSSHRFGDQIAIKPVGQRIYTLSFYAKHNGRNIHPEVDWGGGANRISRTFDLIAGTIGGVGVAGTFSSISASISDVNNGWWFCTMTFLSHPETNLRSTFHLSGRFQSYQGDGTSGFFLWNPQLEEGYIATDYQRIEAAFEVRRNRITFSEQFETAVWARTSSTISPNIATAPNGTMTAYKLTENTDNSAHFTNAILALQPGGNYVASVYAKAGERDHVTVEARASAARGQASFNLITGTVRVTRQVGSIVGVQANILDVGNGWFRCSISFTATVSIFANNVLNVHVDNGTTALTDNGVVYAGDGTSGIFIWGAQFELGSTCTSYQRIGNAFDVTEAGTSSCHYLQFDGIDDSLSTQSVDFTGTDKLMVSTGIRKLTDASQGMIFELSANLNTNPASSYLVTGTNSVAAPNYASASRGTATATFGHGATSTASFAAPISNVVTATHDIAGSLTALRINGVANGTNGTSSKGTGNFGNHPMFIGRRGGSSVPFNGRLFGIVVRGADATTPQLLQTEKLLAKNTSETSLS